MTSSSLFQTYCLAFQSVTGWALDLVLERPSPEAGVLTIPVPMGQIFPFFLVASSPVAGVKPSSLIKGLLEVFAIQLGDEVNRTLICDQGTEPAPVKRAKEVIKSNLSRKYSLDDLAAQVGICPYYLCRLFKAHTGLTLTEYHGRLRVERARQLLINPALSVAEVSERVGFHSISQFNRAFRKYAGDAPREYRDRLRQLEKCDFQIA
ncbi:MAG: helix-turn-helix domain-containing protein [Roseibacillus sp.]